LCSLRNRMASISPVSQQAGHPRMK